MELSEQDAVKLMPHLGDVVSLDSVYTYLMDSNKYSITFTS